MADHFDGLLRWLHARLGTTISVAVTGPPERVTDVGMYARGTLRRDDREITLINGPRGRVEGFRIGDAAVVLVEGDLRSAEFNQGRTVRSDGGLVNIPGSVEADFGELSIVFHEIVES